MEKIKVLTIGDMPLVPSGVAIQSRYMIEGLLKTGRYTFRCIGAAIKHQQYNPIRIADYGDDFIVFPCDGYANPQMMRDLLDYEKPDALWMMSDPRFYGPILEMSDEILDRGVPMLWNTIWDNYPVPKFNKILYDTCTYLGCISELTYDIMVQLGLQHKAEYIPHAVDTSVFKILDEEEVKKEKIKIFGKQKENSFVVFYNSRNARRKKTADLVAAFKVFADKIGDKDGEKCILFMHADPHDSEGSNLFEVCLMLGLKSSQVIFSKNKVEPNQMAMFYNISDVTACISAEEGFGLSSLESLSCGTLVVSTKTGGLQEQNINKETCEVFGVQIEPASKLLVGSQQIPYIFSDHPSHQQVTDALETVYNIGKAKRDEAGIRAKDFVNKKYDLNRMISRWDEIITKFVGEYKNGNPNRCRLTRVA